MNTNPMTLQEIKQWLNEEAYDQALEEGVDIPDRPVARENLTVALLSVGINREDAEAMFVSVDQSLQILSQLTNNYNDVQLVIRANSACISPWNNADEYNWRGYAEGGNLNLALILLILCIKCYPKDTNRSWWGENHWFYINVPWQRDRYDTNL